MQLNEKKVKLTNWEGEFVGWKIRANVTTDQRRARTASLSGDVDGVSDVMSARSRFLLSSFPSRTEGATAIPSWGASWKRKRKKKFLFITALLAPESHCATLLDELGDGLSSRRRVYWAVRGWRAACVSLIWVAFWLVSLSFLLCQVGPRRLVKRELSVVARKPKQDHQSPSEGAADYFVRREREGGNWRYGVSDNDQQTTVHPSAPDVLPRPQTIRMKRNIACTTCGRKMCDFAVFFARAIYRRIRLSNSYLLVSAIW